jgi:hypothetical protein
MGGVGDALDGRLDVAEAVVLRDDGDVAQGSAGAAGVRRVDVGCGAAVAEGVGLQLLVEKRLLRRGRGGDGAARPGGGCGCGLFDGGRGCGGLGCGVGYGVGAVGGELGPGHRLHLLEDRLMLRFVVPVEREGVGVAIDGVRYCNHLVEIRGQACELWQVSLGHGAGRFAVVKIGAGGIVVQGTYTADSCRGDVAAAGFVGVCGGVTLQGGAVGIVGCVGGGGGGRCGVRCVSAGGGAVGAAALHGGPVGIVWGARR